MNKKLPLAIQEFMQTSTADTVLLFGSALESSWTSDSDVDIFIIDNRLQDGVDDITIKGLRFEVQQSNFTIIEQDLIAEEGSLHNRNLATMISTAQILKCHSVQSLEKIKTQAQKTLASPPKYTIEDFKSWNNSVIDYLSKAQKALNGDNLLGFWFAERYTFENLLNIFLAKHSTYLVQPKHLMRDLQKNDPIFAEIVHKWTRSGQHKKRLVYLKQIADYLDIQID